MYFLQIEAEKTKVIAIQQETAASKMKEENQAIRDEAEADLSMFLFREYFNSLRNKESLKIMRTVQLKLYYSKLFYVDALKYTNTVYDRKKTTARYCTYIERESRFQKKILVFVFILQSLCPSLAITIYPQNCSDTFCVKQHERNNDIHFYFQLFLVIRLH